jgi:hypothetical protein
MDMPTVRLMISFMMSRIILRKTLLTQIVHYPLILRTILPNLRMTYIQAPKRMGMTMVPILMKLPQSIYFVIQLGRKSM